MDGNPLRLGEHASLFTASYLRLPKLFFSEASPESVAELRASVLNENLASDFLLANDDIIFMLQSFLSNSGAHPQSLAQAYSGHQFGHFAHLGDGRAHLLGELKDKSGKYWDVHLKGSGQTPYSRRGDGKASLGPMLREYIISEAMQGLGIPTTRTLGVFSTGESVVREKIEPGAILIRLAHSHIRVGTFEWAAAQGEQSELEALLDYAIARHDPDLVGQSDRALLFFRRVLERQARLVAQWMSVGFIHGVMNTDNMAISGQTIDYGPCAFMDTYRANAVFSSIDRGGRYAFANQPSIAQWNLARLAETLLPLLSEDENEAVQMAEIVLKEFGSIFQTQLLANMSSKIGFEEANSTSKELVSGLFSLMELHQLDFTQTFFEIQKEKDKRLPEWQQEPFEMWVSNWQAGLKAVGIEKNEAVEKMKKNNPTVIARNYWVEEAIAGAVERQDFSILSELVSAIREPFNHRHENEKFQALRPEHAGSYKTFCGT